jgi:hypothetical protein
MADSNAAALFAALAKAQAHAKSVEKDARNTFHKYAYASAEAIITEAKESLAHAGLAVVPHSLVVSEASADLKAVGAAAMLHASWVVVHSDGGSMTVGCEWPIVPEKGRPIDKATAAARTASLGYLLRDLLQLPRVEEGTDLDHDSRDEPAKGSLQAAAATDLRRAIGDELDRIGVAGDERTRTVTQVLGRRPDTVADLKTVLETLKEYPTASAKKEGAK